MMSTPTLSRRLRPRAAAGVSVPAAVIVAVVVTIAAGLLIHRQGWVVLGTPLPPFLMSWTPSVRPVPAAIAVVLALGVAVAAPSAIERVRSGPPFATLSYLATLAVGLAMGAARLGTPGWTHVFDLAPGGSWEAKFEYLPALPALHRGVAYYVGHFAQLLPGLPTHTKGNPPGPLVAMHLLSITTPGQLAAACMIVGSLVAPLTYALGRSLGDERRGRIAAAFAACSPCVLIYGFTSVDFVFAAMAGAVACLLVARRRRVRAAGCVTAGIAVFFSWVLLAIPLWAVAVAAVRDGRPAAARLAVASAGGILGVTGLLAWVWGYDPIAIFRAVHHAYRMGAAAHRPYWFWVLGSPAAWLTLLGPPIAWLWLRSLQRRDPAAVALAVVVLVSAIAGFTKAETERIWLPYVPLACVAAAATPVARLRLMLVAMAIEALVIRMLFGTVW
jgi:methylthioxylose transferase